MKQGQRVTVYAVVVDDGKPVVIRRDGVIKGGAWIYLDPRCRGTQPPPFLRHDRVPVSVCAFSIDDAIKAWRSEIMVNVDVCRSRLTQLQNLLDLAPDFDESMLG